jgi:ppGpp synthetase/RelA/SpoT-type nucleotidyltranferase
MTLTKSQIERLGYRLLGSTQPAADDLAALHELLLIYGDALADAAASVQRDLGIVPTARIKTTGTILEKLERHGGSWLKSIQDIAGMRIVGSFGRVGQDVLAAQLVELFADAGRRPKVVDRRADPSHGYQAVHVIAFIGSVPVEIQVRTQLQHQWADLFEKLADRIGRGIRYGEPPDHWLTEAEREALSEGDQEIYELEHRIRSHIVNGAQAVAGMVDAYELGEMLDPGDPELREYRSQVDAALVTLTKQLDDLALSEDDG